MTIPRKMIDLNMDNQPLRAEADATILKVAEANGIYIPTLCAHKDLTPFGGCRLCIVEVEGMRGFPTACTTPVTDGMTIRTNTSQLQAIRTEILQLILSEHPCSCLICDEQDECKEFNATIRKAAVTTGCRYCSNDGQCELADVVKWLGIKEINYPISYRYLPVEKDDPFYDRDYNLCILCGRCVRMCQEIRMADTLAFKQRGQRTIIGPAYSRTHLEAGCEFCGACVSVCPTGALSEKTSKWQGKAESEAVTTCALCGVGCQLNLQIRDNKVINVLPAEDHLINNGQLCVKGRFCIPELVNNHKRLRRPRYFHGGIEEQLSLEKAIEIAAGKLSHCPPEQFGMIISSNCTNEDLYVAQKFVRTVMDSNNIDTMSRVSYGSAFGAYLNLMNKCTTMEDLRKASAIICIGLDTRFGQSVVGVELRKAGKRGAKIITINPRPHNLTVVADKWLQPETGQEAGLIDKLAKLMEIGANKSKGVKRPAASKGIRAELAEAIGILCEAESVVILVGSDVIQYRGSSDIFESIDKLAQTLQAGVMLLPAQNNLYGSLMMGTYPEILPGGYSSTDKARLNHFAKLWGSELSDSNLSWNAESVARGREIKVLYLLGEIPLKSRPAADFVIFQNIYAPDFFNPEELVIPSAAFTEVDGTFINGEGRLQKVRKAVDPPANVFPDWKILSLIAQKMEKKGFEYLSSEDIRIEISRVIMGFHNSDESLRPILPFKSEFHLSAVSEGEMVNFKSKGQKPFLLQTRVAEHTYRGFTLSAFVDGMKAISDENVLEINPDDAKELGLSCDDEAIVKSEEFEKIWPVKITPQQPARMLRVTLSPGDFSGHNPYPVKIRKNNV